MPFDHYIAAAEANELNRFLSGGRIEKIYQPEREELLLQINTLPGKYDRKRAVLLLSSESRRPVAYLSDTSANNPMNPPSFCMLLRKHLNGGRIGRIFALPHERIIMIEIESMGELGIKQTYLLILETMGKHSNIFLVNPDTEKIIDCIKRVSPEMSRLRHAFPGASYTAPPPAKGISPVMEREVETGISIEYYDRLAEENNYSPQIFLNQEGEMQDFHVFPLRIYESLQTLRFDSISEMLETWYAHKVEGNRVNQKVSDIQKILKTRLDKLYLKKQRLLEDLNQAEQADEFRLLGELITANIYQMKKGETEVKLLNYNQPSGENAEPQSITVALDPRKTPSENAQQYFKKYNKAKSSVAIKHEQLALTEQDIEFLESYQVYLRDAKDSDAVDALREELAQLGYMRSKKKQAKAKKNEPQFLLYKTASGLTILVGKNNRENDVLTLKKAAPNHLWLHTKDIPGSHVILAASTEKRDEASILQAAQIAAWYSKARGSEGVPVDYTEVRYVKKPNGAKPGMVIFTHNKTLYVTPQVPSGAL
jgi:predicted ribosome quality control (RQC) complex YloA/Tae2 family protein